MDSRDYVAPDQTTNTLQQSSVQKRKQTPINHQTTKLRKKVLAQQNQKDSENSSCVNLVDVAHSEI